MSGGSCFGVFLPADLNRLRTLVPGFCVGYGWERTFLPVKKRKECLLVGSS